MRGTMGNPNNNDGGGGGGGGGRFRRPNVQSLCNDGLGYCGRIAAIGGMFVLGFYLIALQSSNWSETSNLSMGQGLETIGEARFGLSEYCLRTAVEGFQGQYFTCHSYDEILSVRGFNGTWHNETGCNRFGSVCSSNEHVRASLAFAVLFLFAGAVFSEKVHINGFMVACGAGAGAYAMFSWVAFQDGLDSAEGLSAGPGLGFVAGGFVLSLLCAVGTCVDCCVINKDAKPDLCEDGINWHGRVGSALTVITWVFVLIGVTMSDWTTTEDLGAAGGLCNDAAKSLVGNFPIVPCRGNRAEFALLEYCVEAYVPLYGYQKSDVCIDYSEEVTIVGTNITETGWDRFADFDLELRSTICYFAAVSTVACAGLADLFSEKLLPCVILCACACLGGLTAMSAWLSFSFGLDGELNEASSSGDGLFFVMGSWMVALAGSILYYIDYRAYKRTHQSSGGCCGGCCGCCCGNEGGDRSGDGGGSSGGDSKDGKNQEHFEDPNGQSHI